MYHSMRVLVRGLWLACIVYGGRASAAGPGAISDDNRRDAGCIDAYNDPAFHDADEVYFRRNSALVRIRAEGVGAAADHDDRAALRGIGYGARFDIDSPTVPFYSSAATDTGVIGGLSGIASIVPGQGRSYTGELRLGLARDKYTVAWSSALSRCMRQRSHLGIDFMRWRAGAFTSVETPGQPTTFVSSIGFPGLVYRRLYPVWGFGVTGTVLEFRLAPSFEWGANVGAEVYYRWLVVSMTVAGHFAPDPSIVAAIGVGVPFEL